MTEVRSQVSALRYHQETLDLSNENSVHARLLEFAGRNKHVLEIGPATGYVTRELASRGCLVTGLEIDAEAARVAAEFCERMIVGSIEAIDLKECLGEQQFDVIMLGDVLEHLVDPAASLDKLRPFLERDGSLVISVPNIAHGSLRLALLEGRFDYTDLGLLDVTHVRFFTQQSLTSLLESTGFHIEELQRVIVDPFSSEQFVDESKYPSILVEGLRRDANALAYQFALRAKLSGSRIRGFTRNSPDSTILDALSELQVTESKAAELPSLEQSLAQQTSLIRQAEFDAEIEKGSLRHELDQRDAKLEEANRDRVALRSQMQEQGAMLEEANRDRVALHGQMQGQSVKLEEARTAAQGLYDQIHDHEVTLSGLRRTLAAQLGELLVARRDLGSQAHLDAALRTITRELAAKQRETVDLMDALNERESSLTELREAAAAAQRQSQMRIEQGERDFAEFRSRPTVRFADGARSRILRLAPPGTLRGVPFVLLGRGLGYLTTMGPKRFLFRVLSPWTWGK